MKDQNSIPDNETKSEKWDRGKTLFLESLYKADHQLRGCAHNQKCYNERVCTKHYQVDYMLKIVL